MRKLLFAAALMMPCAVSAWAQDVPGIELCTHETRMDRRTGCLQSNVEYLLKLIGKNAADTQQKLNAAAAEIAALKSALASAQAKVEALQASVDKLQAAAAKAEGAAKKNGGAAKGQGK
jgi:uncharacterized protein YlxW (UPF0749 family)